MVSPPSIHPYAHRIILSRSTHASVCAYVWCVFAYARSAQTSTRRTRHLALHKRTHTQYIYIYIFAFNWIQNKQRKTFARVQRICPMISVRRRLDLRSAIIGLHTRSQPSVGVIRKILKLGHLGQTHKHTYARLFKTTTSSYTHTQHKHTHTHLAKRKTPQIAATQVTMDADSEWWRRRFCTTKKKRDHRHLIGMWWNVCRLIVLRMCAWMNRRPRDIDNTSIVHAHLWMLDIFHLYNTTMYVR